MPQRARFVFLLSLLLVGCASTAQPRVDVGGRALAVELAGTGDLTVVFESGGGNDGAVWAEIAPEVRRHHGVRTFVYDRAGLGASDPAPQPYRIDDDVTALRTALDRTGVQGGVVLVAHSYGGYIATLIAEDPRLVGLVLVDAAIPGSLDEDGVDRILAKYRPQYDTLRQVAPVLAARMIPMMEAYPATVERVNRSAVPAALPVIDLLAEDTLGDTPEEKEAFRQAHAAFVAASPARESMLATGSSHHVMRDRPDAVLDAIARMIARVRSSE